MRFYFNLSALFFFLILLISGCSKFSNKLEVVHRNFDDEIAQQQNLTFTFNKDLVGDSLLNKWDSTSYIAFEPAVKGKFRWSSSKELTFSPFEPFAPSTQYKATLQPAISNVSKEKPALSKDNTFTFHTPILALTGAHIYRTMSARQANQVDVKVDLNFNYPVKPSEVERLTHLLVDGKEVKAEIATSEVDQSISFIIPDQADDQQESLPLKVVIDKGLKPVGGNYASPEKLVYESEIPPKGLFQVTEITGSFVEGQGVLNVFMNQPVTAEDLAKHIRLEPNIPFTAEAHNNGFEVRGNFRSGQNYNVILSKNLKSIFGNELKKEHSQYISFGSLQPTIGFANNKAVYLSAAGNRNLGVNLTDIAKVKVTIARVYANNIQSFLRTGQDYGYHYDEDEEYSEEGEYIDRSYYYYNYNDFGNVVSERTYETKNLPKHNNQHLLNISLADLDFNNEFKGIYVVKIEDSERMWLQASKIISVSDIGLIARQSQDEVLIFANSIKTTQALPNIKINFVSTNNQVVQTATTDKNGVARFAGSPKNKQFRIGMVTAQNGPDFNYMLFESNRVETSRFEVGGLQSNPARYDAFIYGDRDIYRPGDTIHVNTILRTQDWKTLTNIPVKIKLLMPTGREYKAFRQTLNSQGAFQSTFYLPAAVMTGQYTIEVYSGNDVLLNSKKISVEEFIPDRIKVDLKLDKASAKPGETVTASVTATNLFGPPAAGRRYEFDFSLKRKTFEPKAFPDYTFELQGANNITFQNTLKTGSTDEQGQASETYEIPDYTDLGVLEGRVFATVFDETGRSVNRLKTFEVPTQQAFFGIKQFSEWISTRQQMGIQLLALNKDGKLLNGATGRVEVIRKVWETVIQNHGGRYNYNSQKREQLLVSQDVRFTNGKATFSYSPLYSGEYEIRIRRPGAETFVTKRFYAYGYGDTQSNSFEVSNEGEVTIEFDKASYEVGDKANILFKSPFAGKILVTVERNQVYEHFYVNTDKKSGSLSLPIKDEFLPNVYITATAIREMTPNSSLPLTVARGFKPLSVTKASTKLPVVITAPEQMRSQKTQLINVKTAPNAEVTVAVVDEGILQLKNYITPDPFGFFYQKRALEVNPFDLYPYLFPELKAGRSSTGGDGFDLSKRINPLTSKRVNLVSFWSGILKANANGEISYRVPVPQFSGALRVMAVAYKDNAFGSSEKFIKVSDPVVISTALPRFLSPGDTVLMPVTLSNTTAKPASATAKLQLSGPLAIAGSASQTASISPNSEKQVLFKIYSKNSIGNGSVLVTVDALNETFLEKTEISVRPPASLQKITGNGSLKGGDESHSIRFWNDFIPGSASARLIVSKSPMVQFAGDLRYLLQYPYGCVEQTISAAFPQLYYADLAKALKQDKKATRYNPDYHVQEAIRKLEAMQLHNGGMAYWPGTDQESWWSTAYAAHFLMEAKKAGFAVNDKMLNKMFEYLQLKLKTRETERYFYTDENGRSLSKTIAKKEIFYSIYVLALAGKYDVTAMNYYKANPGLLAIDSKYLLAASYAMYGNNRNFLAMLPKSFSGEYSKRELDGSFYSAIRDEAIALNALLEAEPNHPEVGIMSRHLSEKVKKAKWLSTQERAFALLALGKLARASAGQNVTATVSAGGRQLGKFDGDELVLTQNLVNQNITVKASGSGNLYYFWEQEGISPTGTYKEEDSYLRVRKTFYDRNGNQISNNQFRINDLILVKLTIQATDLNATVENVAITDMLPAGFEIENPRIGAVREVAWVKDMATPDYFDIRDDRINLFTTATPSPKNFYYLVRAVSRGQYKMGPVSADAMYNAEYHSYWGSGMIVVK